MRDPFAEYTGVPVNGGALNVARAGPPPGSAATVVLAVHGITASHMAWRAVARELCEDGAVCLLAPDLRGRGASSKLPDPFGLSAHIDDLLAVLDHAGAPRVVLAGHSLGAHIVARLAAEHPGRAASLVLLDGGLPVPQGPEAWDDEPSDTAADDRMDDTADSADDYLARWRGHPGYARAWNDDVEAYVRYDMVEDEDSARCVVSKDAVMADCFDLMLDGTTRTAVSRVRAPVRLLHASRGCYDDDALITPSALEWLRTGRPDTLVEQVADVNHYTLMLGDSPGPARVAAVINEAVLEL